MKIVAILNWDLEIQSMCLYQRKQQPRSSNTDHRCRQQQQRSWSILCEHIFPPKPRVSAASRSPPLCKSYRPIDPFLGRGGSEGKICPHLSSRRANLLNCNSYSELSYSFAMPKSEEASQGAASRCEWDPRDKLTSMTRYVAPRSWLFVCLRGPLRSPHECRPSLRKQKILTDLRFRERERERALRVACMLWSRLDAWQFRWIEGAIFVCLTTTREIRS